MKPLRDALTGWHRRFMTLEPVERSIVLPGLAVAAMTLLAGVAPLMPFGDELPDLPRGSGALVVVDVGVRVVGGIAFAALAFLPYGTALRTARATGCRRVAAAVAWLVFAVNLWYLYAEFLAPRACCGASFLLVFLPLYLTLPVLVMWGALKAVRYRR